MIWSTGDQDTLPAINASRAKVNGEWRAMPDFEANPIGTMEALRRAREALGKALSYLRASTDPIPAQPAIGISPTRQLLSEADATEAKDKAIFQARATLDELNKLLGDEP